MFKTFAAKIGLDKAIFYTASARMFQGVGGVVSVLLVATCLTGVEQGFYYTFASILAIQVFFELGLGSIITQFVAHEKAHLTEEDNTLIGAEGHQSRLADLLRFCIKWYSVLAVAIFVLLSVVGFLFFSYFYTSPEVVDWKWPWILLIFGSSLNFLIAPFSAFLEGLGKVKEIAKIRFLQQIIGQVAVWTALLGGFKLYVGAIGPFIGFVIFVAMVWPKFGPLLRGIRRHLIVERVGYMKEIFPLQWRIGLSWISGYFIFQLFNPVLFATEGAVVAGQMGMTLSVLNAIMSLSDSWISTKVPALSGLIATREYTLLDRLFRTIQQQSVLIATVCVSVFVLGVWLIDSLGVELIGKPLASRFLGYGPILLMASTVVMRQLQSSWAIYLRCHKQEPLMWVSICMGVMCTISTLILGNAYGVYGMTSGYALLTFGSTIAIYIIFKNKKVEWHRS